MPTEKIDFANNLQSGHEELAGASQQATNVVVDGRGAVLRRPGISAYDVVPPGVIDSDGIDGLHASLDGDLYALSAGIGARTLYRIQAGTAVPYTNHIAGPERPIFAETETLVAFATGTFPYRVLKDSKTLDFLGGGPPQCSHIIATANRLLANDTIEDTSQINFSALSEGGSGLEDWTFTGLPGGAGFFPANASPGPVMALNVATADTFVFGDSDVELHGVDSTGQFARTNVREYGMSAPYSVVKLDQSFVWLDHRRRFVMSDGRNLDTKMGLPIQAVLNGMTRVDDCFGYRVHMDQIDCLVFTFPSEGMTFSYQVMAGWSQWQGYDTATAAFRQHRVLSHHYRSDDDTHVVGMDDGLIAKYDMSATTDLGDIIAADVTTGFLDRGTDHRKQCKAVHIALSRGTATSGSEPVGFLSYADAPGQWVDRIPLHLGMADDTDPVITLRSLGWYRRRQWKFEFSGNVRLALVSVKEDFEILEQ